VELVVDTSAIVAVLASEPERRALVTVTRGADLIAPTSVNWEVGNALVGLLKKRRGTLEDVRRALRIYHQIPLRFLEVDLETAVELAAKHHLYAYDAYVLTCARQQRCGLVALDTTLLRVARALGIPIVEV